MPRDNQHERQSPINPVTGADPDASGAPEHGIALCLSGGGYRAMLFHVGALWRLNEPACLPKLDRISSVSGGSITAGVLALRWSGSASTAAASPQPSRGGSIPFAQMAGKTIDDRRDPRRDCCCPARSAPRSPAAYGKHLFGDATLQDLPRPPALRHQRDQRADRDRCWRFIAAVHGRLPGRARSTNPTVALALAVAASSAFPPVLSPVRARVRPHAASRRRPGTTCSVSRSPQRRAHRRRRLRQPRPRDGVEALRHDPRQRCRRQDGGRRQSPSPTG